MTEEDLEDGVLVHWDAFSDQDLADQLSGIELPQVPLLNGLLREVRQRLLRTHGGPRLTASIQDVIDAKDEMSDPARKVQTHHTSEPQGDRKCSSTAPGARAKFSRSKTNR